MKKIALFFILFIKCASLNASNQYNRIAVMPVGSMGGFYVERPNWLTGDTIFDRKVIAVHSLLPQDEKIKIFGIETTCKNVLLVQAPENYSPLFIRRTSYGQPFVNAHNYIHCYNQSADDKKLTKSQYRAILAQAYQIENAEKDRKSTTLNPLHKQK